MYFALFLLLAASYLQIAKCTLGSMCCGDNFCCALDDDGAVDCWGGSSFGTAPSGDGYIGIACHGKGGIVIDSDMEIAECFGTAEYGSEGCPTGDEIVDASMGFWGGCAILASDNTLTCWGQSTGYGYNSYPDVDDCTDSDGECSEVNLLMTPPSGEFSTVACGGKRAGVMCCGVSCTSGDTECWGAGSEPDYIPDDQVGKEYEYMSCGTDFCCGMLTIPGDVECFGNLEQADDDGAGGTDIPSTLSGDYEALACGNFACYFIDEDGNFEAYGRVFSNDVGPVDAGTDTTDFSGIGGTITWLPTVAGFAHACVGSDTGAVYCWGADYLGQVADAPTNNIVSADDAYSNPVVDCSDDDDEDEDEDDDEDDDDDDDDDDDVGGGSDGTICFSGDTTVTVLGRDAPVKLHDLRIGDFVLTGKSVLRASKEQNRFDSTFASDDRGGEYQRVYAFGHKHKEEVGQYLKITADLMPQQKPEYHSNNNTKVVNMMLPVVEPMPVPMSSFLEISHKHLIYIEGKSNPIRADALKVNDYIMFHSDVTKAKVTKIEEVSRQGLYAPLTTHGTIVVNDGFVASTYVAVQDGNQQQETSLPDRSPQVELNWQEGWTVPFFTQTSVIHWWMSPLRMLCDNGLAMRLKTEDEGRFFTMSPFQICHMQNEKGINYYASWGLHLAEVMERQHVLIQVVLVVTLLFFLLSMGIEYFTIFLIERFHFISQSFMQLAASAGWSSFTGIH